MFKSVNTKRTIRYTDNTSSLFSDLELYNDDSVAFSLHLGSKTIFFDKISDIVLLKSILEDVVKVLDERTETRSI